MANMSYCRFQNTLSDLQDCLQNISEPLQGDEKRAREQLVEVCREIVAWEDEGAEEETEPRTCADCGDPCDEEKEFCEGCLADRAKAVSK